MRVVELGTMTSLDLVTYLNTMKLWDRSPDANVSRSSFEYYDCASPSFCFLLLALTILGEEAFSYENVRRLLLDKGLLI